MKTLYINISGENIQSTDDVIVVGKPENALINKFHFELGNEIKRRVYAPDVKQAALINGFMSLYKSIYEEKILPQLDTAKYLMLSQDLRGNYSIQLPQEYIEWLNYNGESVYSEIAKSLKEQDGIVEINLARIYRNGIMLLVNNIEPGNYSQLVVNDNAVEDDTEMIVAIRNKVNNPMLPFIPYVESENDNQNSFQHNKNETDSFMTLSGEVNIIDFPIDCGMETVIDANPFRGFSAYNNKATRSGLPLFGDGLILIENLSNHRFGYINERCEIIIPCIYPDALPFAGGLAWVRQDDEVGKWFIIDVKGIVKNIVSSPFHIQYCNGSQLRIETPQIENSFYSQSGDLIGRNSLLSKQNYYSISKDGIYYSRNGHDKYYKNHNKIIETEDIIVIASDNMYGVSNKVSGKVYIPIEYSRILYLGKYYFYLEKDSKHKYLAKINI